MDQLSFSGGRLAVVVDQHVGERIRQRRTLLGFTQEQLAEALQISYQQIQKYETGANRVSAGRLYQIARRLDVDVSHFFSGLDALGHSEEAPRQGSSSRAVIDLVRHFQQIDDQGVRAAVLSLVKNLSSAGREEARSTEDANGQAADAGRD